MGKVRVEHGEVRRATQAQPMRWAMLKATGAAIYISMLGPDQNGNECGCQCPSCGENLQAVNVGKDASHFQKANTRGMFFRHPSGHQRKDCNFLAAKLAALHLLMECGEVDLPPPKRSGVLHGISGTTYTGIAKGQSWRGSITSKVWLDSQSAKITLNGRTVLVLLEARPRLMSEAGVDGIITIRVNDPDVASWDPDQILAALKLDEFSCWEKHWDDDELADEAQRKALVLADAAMDFLPLELGSLDGLTNLQKSETVLHAKVKDILATAGKLRVPSCEQDVSRVMIDGNQRSSAVRINAQDLTLSDVKLESPLSGMVPDVLCTACGSRNPYENTFTLQIEVAVTHRVDAAKRAKIVSHNLACIEIDLTRMGGLHGRITVDQLRTAVLDATDCKSWVFNPVLALMVSSREQDLERKDQELRRLYQWEAERLEWLDECSTERLIELLLPALKHHWLTDGPMTVDDGFEVLPEEIAERLTTHGFKDACDRALLKKDGVLSCLEDIRNRHLNNDSAGKFGGLWRLGQDQELRRYANLGLIAAKAYPLILSPEDKEQFDKLRLKVMDSWNRGEVEYARPAIHDGLIGRLFPEMRDLLAKPFGTRGALQAKDELKRQQERAEAKKKALVEAERVVAFQLEQEKQLKEYAKKLERREKVHSLLLRESVNGWTQGTSVDTIEMVLEQISVVRLAGKYARSGMNVEALLSSAWDARARSHSFREWFSDQNSEGMEKAPMMLAALRTAGLLR